jgi:imidazoleglycerol-phosphate dehydratase
MLTLFSRHGFIDLTVLGKGDIEVDYHHLVEDVGISLGEAFRRALGDMKGIARYGHAVVPMIEALAAVTVDISARPHLVYRIPLKNEKVGKFDVELVEEFFRAFAQSSGTCVHVNVEYGSNAHHTVEAVFKAFGRAMSEATRFDPRVKDVHSSKGVLG